MIDFSIGSKLVRKVIKSEMKRPLLFVLLLIVLVCPRWYYVEHFAVALPFWDQWDAEWAGLLKPWIEGKLAFTDLWKRHNEHRIFPTRLMTLLSFEFIGFWSNLSEARSNILLGVSTPLLLIWLLHKRRQLHGLRWLVVALIVAGATLPFSWENMLIGFQSQFYFLNLFALSAFALAVWRAENTWALIAVAGLCALSVMTMASGLITPIAVAIVYGVNGYLLGTWSVKKLPAILVLLLISLIGFITIPYVEGHQVLRAQNITEMFKTTIRIMGWPLTAHKLYIGLLWLPALITIPVLLSQRRFTRCDLLMSGCFIWTGAQILALAYGRGHELHDVPSRYTEILQLGLAGNAWFVVRSTEEFCIRRNAGIIIRLIALTFFASVFLSHLRRFPRDLAAMKKDLEMRLIQTKNVHSYLQTRDKRILQKPSMQIPYPNPEGLQKILDDPTVQNVLPPAP